MNLVILGASGACGRLLVEQASAGGHHVVAVGRTSSDLGHVDDSAVRRGNVDDEAFLTQAFEGADVVLVALGQKLSSLSPFAKSEDPTLMSRAGPAIAAAAAKAGVKRILAISAGGVGDSRTLMPFFFKALIAVTSLRIAYPDLDRFEQALFAGPVMVCCVRPTGLTDGPLTGRAVVTEKLVGNATISRADVAAFMLAHLEGELPGKGPIITVTGAA
jgi:uncharacterized protein YbjT (DUF2867 family)